MENTTINWAADFGVNEFLHGTSAELAGMYSRLIWHNPNHPDVETWERKSSEWMEYESEMINLFFATEEEANIEIKRLAEEFKQIHALERMLLRKQGLI